MSAPIVIRDLRHLALELQKRRYANGQTIRSLGARTGHGHERISAWENARHAPSTASLLRVLHGLGYDLALIPREDT
jgi:transcriptional regulator with XRE-family HTH domain